MRSWGFFGGRRPAGITPESFRHDSAFEIHRGELWVECLGKSLKKKDNCTNLAFPPLFKTTRMLAFFLPFSEG